MPGYVRIWQALISLVVLVLFYTESFLLGHYLQSLVIGMGASHTSACSGVAQLYEQGHLPLFQNLHAMSDTDQCVC